LEYAGINKPHIGKTATSDDKVGVFVDRPGEIMEELRVVRGWFGIGQGVSGDFTEKIIV